MAETIIENRVCKECGVDVRPNTTFCYNCGKSVTETPDPDLPPEPSSAWFSETLVGDEPVPDLIETRDEAGADEGMVRAEPEHIISKTESEAALPSEDVAEEAVPEEAVPEEARKDELEEANENEPARSAGEDIDPVHHSMPVESGLKSAASMRGKPKVYQRREVEVVWEPAESSSALKYVLITLFVVLFTIVVFWFAMSMK